MMVYGRESDLFLPQRHGVELVQDTSPNHINSRTLQSHLFIKQLIKAYRVYME